MTSAMSTTTTLNEDCWRAVMWQFEGDFQQLFQLATCCRLFFHAVIPVLYTEPFKDISQGRMSGYRPYGRMAIFSESRLESLIIRCSPNFILPEDELNRIEAPEGYDLPSRLRNPPWQAKDKILWVMDHPTINYAAFIKTMSPRPFRLMWMDVQGKPDAALRKICLVAHVKFFGGKLSKLEIAIPDSQSVLDLVPHLTVLKHIHFTNLFLATSVDPTHLQAALNLVKRHVEVFPGLLESIDLDFADQQWDLYMELHRAIKQGPTSIQVHIYGSKGLEKLCTDRVRSIEFQTSRQSDLIPIQAPFLSRCRNLQVAGVFCCRPDAFTWAREEYDLHQQTANFLPLSKKLLKLKPLVPLQKFEGYGLTGTLVDVLSGFRDTLREVDFQYFESGKVDATADAISWSWALPKLQHLKLSYQDVDSSCFVQCCPNLRSLIVSFAIWKPRVPQPLFTVPIMLQRLILVDNASEYFDPASIKHLIVLEELSLGWRLHVPMIEDDPIQDVKGWWLPCLRKVYLRNQWTARFQASLLSVAPNLETLELHFFSLKEKLELDLESFKHCAKVSTQQTVLVTYPSLKTLKLGGFSINPQSQDSFLALFGKSGPFPNLKSHEFLNIQDHLTTGNRWMMDLCVQAIHRLLDQPSMKTVILHPTENKLMAELDLKVVPKNAEYYDPPRGKELGCVVKFGSGQHYKERKQ